MGRTGATLGPRPVQTGALDSRTEREGAGQSRAEAINDRSRGGIHAGACVTLSGLAEPTPVKKVGQRGAKMMGWKEGGAAYVRGAIQAGTHVKAEMTGHSGARPGLRLILLGATDPAEGNRGRGRAGTSPRSH